MCRKKVLLGLLLLAVSLAALFRFTAVPEEPPPKIGFVILGEGMRLQHDRLFPAYVPSPLSGWGVGGDADKDGFTHTHALKSSSLSLGGKRLSEAAKESEALGKLLLADDTEEAEEEKSLAGIRESHEKLLALYDELPERLREEVRRS